MEHPLLQFCLSDNQRLIVTEHIEKGIPLSEVCRQAGISERGMRKSKQMILARAAMQGYSPDHNWTHPVPDGHKVKGVSTYYNDEGKPIGQWVKSQTDEQRQFEILVERLEQAQEGLKPFRPTKPPAAFNERLLSCLVITDFHLGEYAWEAETGESWDIQVARDTFMNAISDMIRACPKSETGLLCQLGDFLHWDGLVSETPTGKNPVDADTRFGKLVELSMSVMTEAVRMMLKRFNKVVVVSAEGNHDIAGSLWLRKHIKHLFQNEPRLQVIDNEFPYYAYLHGETMLGFHHGHKMKMSNLHKLFASEPRFREMWGQATYTYIHCGHYHHEKVVEDGGAIAEQHPTLAARNSYEARGGWLSRRGAKVITYDKIDGEVARVTVRPRL